MTRQVPCLVSAVGKNGVQFDHAVGSADDLDLCSGLVEVVATS